MKYIIIVLSLFVTIQSFGASDKEPDFELPDFGYVFELTDQLQKISGEQVNMFGIRGGLTFNTNYAVGFSFKFSTNRILPADEIDKNVFLNVALTSAYIEYTLKPSSRVHLTFPLDIGGGDVNMEWKEYRSSDPFPYGEKYFFYVEPGAKLEIAITKKLLINLGATYVFVPKLDYRAVTAKNISGPSAIVGIKYGKFL
ncbi:MAG: hypothetical protein KJP21_09880 [Bacteroidia bacterium]|nr:hypothetical protein [Bacteroidia bacterium]NNJ55411.1 hypothetical protein [Bacteroidia bacterium]